MLYIQTVSSWKRELRQYISFVRLGLRELHACAICWAIVHPTPSVENKNNLVRKIELVRFQLARSTLGTSTEASLNESQCSLTGRINKQRTSLGKKLLPDCGGSSGRDKMHRTAATVFNLARINTSLIQRMACQPELGLRPFSSGNIIKPPDEFTHYNPEIVPGGEKYHQNVKVSGNEDKTFKWPTYNDIVYPPDGTYRPAFVTHMESNIKYSPEKMWQIACLLRGKTVEEAFKQLMFLNLKGARIMERILQDAQEIAVREQHFEFKSNMWVAEALTDQSKIIRGMRRHRRRIGVIRYRYCNVYLRLEEGKPPKHYIGFARQMSPEEQIEKFLQEHRLKRLVVD